MGHGGGGQMSAELIEHLFVPAFGSSPGGLADSAVVELGGARIAFSTDTFVVRPLFFPGGSIGHLAVNGTINDLAMSGSTPAHLSCGFVLEEGTELGIVGRVASDMGAAARAAGVTIVTGDTKVVDSGHGDQVYVNTAGLGLVPSGVDIRPDGARPGDVVIVSGAIGVHGIAIMSVREGLGFGSEITSDTAALHPLVAAMLAVTPDLHALRDPTRGGLTRSRPRRASACAWWRRPFRCRPKSATPARCWASTRFTWRTRASSWRSCPASTATPSWRRCGPIRLAVAPPSSASVWRTTRRWW